MVLKGKIAFVTGGSRGIGRAIVKGFVAAGAIVYFSYQSNIQAAKKVCEESHLKNENAIKVDVRDRKSIRDALTHIESAHARLDILVNNAGINNPCDFDKITDEDWDNILNVNLKGPFVVTQESINLLRASASGSVIHISSVSGQYGGPRTAHYAASKAGLISLSQVIARFLAEDNVRSNTIAAGLIFSEMAAAGLNSTAVKSAAEKIIQKRLGAASEVADLAVYLASDESSYITAQTININGGLYF